MNVNIVVHKGLSMFTETLMLLHSDKVITFQQNTGHMNSNPIINNCLVNCGLLATIFLQK